MMTPQRLAAIKERCERATPGPWRVVRNRHKDRFGLPWGRIVAEWTTQTGGRMRRVVVVWGDDNGAADAAFIAHARTDIPDLIVEVERLQAVVDGIEALVGRIEQRATLERERADDEERWKDYCRGEAAAWRTAAAWLAAVLRDHGVGGGGRRDA